MKSELEMCWTQGWCANCCTHMLLIDLGLIPSSGRNLSIIMSWLTLYANQSPVHWVSRIFPQGIIQRRCDADLASYVLWRIRIYSNLPPCSLYAFVEWCLGTGSFFFLYLFFLRHFHFKWITWQTIICLSSHNCFSTVSSHGIPFLFVTHQPSPWLHVNITGGGSIQAYQCDIKQGPSLWHFEGSW